MLESDEGQGKLRCQLDMLQQNIIGRGFFVSAYAGCVRQIEGSNSWHEELW